MMFNAYKIGNVMKDKRFTKGFTRWKEWSNDTDTSSDESSDSYEESSDDEENPTETEALLLEKIEIDIICENKD